MFAVCKYLPIKNNAIQKMMKIYYRFQLIVQSEPNTPKPLIYTVFWLPKSVEQENIPTYVGGKDLRKQRRFRFCFILLREVRVPRRGYRLARRVNKFKNKL